MNKPLTTTYAAQGLGQMMLWKISTDRVEFEKLTQRRYVDLEQLESAMQGLYDDLIGRSYLDGNPDKIFQKWLPVLEGKIK